MSRFIADFDQVVRARCLAEFSKIVATEGAEAGEQYLLKFEWKYGFNPFDLPVDDRHEPRGENTFFQKLLLGLFNTSLVIITIFLIAGANA